MTEDKKTPCNDNDDHDSTEVTCYTAALHRVEDSAERPGRIRVTFRLQQPNTAAIEDVVDMFCCFDDAIECLGLCFVDLPMLRTIYTAKNIHDLDPIIGSLIDLEIGLCGCCTTPFISDYDIAGTLVGSDTLDTSSDTVRRPGGDIFLL